MYRWEPCERTASIYSQTSAIRHSHSQQQLFLEQGPLAIFPPDHLDVTVVTIPLKTILDSICQPQNCARVSPNTAHLLSESPPGNTNTCTLHHAADIIPRLSDLRVFSGVRNVLSESTVHPPSQKLKRPTLSARLAKYRGKIAIVPIGEG